MALMDLKSDLSWYGKSAPGFKPNANASDTRFNNEGASPSVQASGYEIMEMYYHRQQGMQQIHLL